MKPSLRSLTPLLAALLSVASVSAADSTPSNPRTQARSTAEPAEIRRLAESKYLDGDLAAAMHFYRELSRLEPTPESKARALVHTAWLETLLDEPEAAFETLERALNVDPDLRVEARLFNEEFERIYLRARVQAIQEERHERARWQTEPTPAPGPRPRDVYQAAVGRLGQGRSDEALSLFQRAAALTYGSSTEAHLEIRRPALVHTGILFYARQQWADAATAFEAALELDRSDVSVWRNLGLAQLQQDDLPKAIEALLEAYTREPGTVDHALSLGTALVRAERWDDTVSWLDDATRHHPREALLWNHLALAHAARGATDRARQAWSRAIQVDSSLDGSLASRAALRLGLSYYEAQEWEAAERTAAEALESDPREAALWNLLGLAQQARGETIDARQAFLHACLHDESSARYRNNLGRAYAEVGNLVEAEEAFVHALTLEPGFDPARQSLARVRQQLSTAGGYR